MFPELGVKLKVFPSVLVLCQLLCYICCNSKWRHSRSKRRNSSRRPGQKCFLAGLSISNGGMAKSLSVFKGFCCGLMV